MKNTWIWTSISISDISYDDIIIRLYINVLDTLTYFKLYVVLFNWQIILLLSQNKCLKLEHFLPIEQYYFRKSQKMYFSVSWLFKLLKGLKQ